MKWKYWTEVVTLHPGEPLNIPPLLKARGLEGWELISFENHQTHLGQQATFIFKRPIEPTPPETEGTDATH